MGAEYCDAVVVVDASPLAALKRAFAEVVEGDAYLYGHSGYTGTFAEKDPDKIEIVTELNGEPKEVWTEAEAREHATNYADKYGPALAYRLDTGKWYIGGWCSA